MPTLIDSLVVSLGLDASKFTTGQKQTVDALRQTSAASDTAAKNMELAAKHMAEGFVRVRNEVLGLFAAFTAGRGLKEMFSDILRGDSALGRMAASLNMSTPELAAWEGAATRAGGTAEGIAGSFQTFNSQMEAAKWGQADTGFIGGLNILGVKLRDLDTGKMKDTSELFLELADKFHNMPVARGNFLGSQLHLDQSTINFLRQGRAEVERLRAAQAKLGVPTDADARLSQSLLNDLRDVQQAVEDFARSLERDLGPDIDKILKGLVDWLEKNKQWLKTEISQKVRDLRDFLAGINWEAIGAGIKAFADGAAGAAKAVGSWQTATEVLLGLWLGSKFDTALSRVGLLRLGIAAAAAELIAFGAERLDATLDKTYPWASNLDNWLSEHLGLGHSYKQQQEQFGGAAGHAAPSTAEQKDRAKQAMDYFTSQGWTKEQAAGIVGNLQQESSFDAQSGKGTAHQGIAQWEIGRQRDIEAHFGKALMSMSYAEQLQAVQWELTEGKYKEVGNRLRQATVARQAAAIVDHGYESPGNYLVEDANRGANAEAWAKGYKPGNLPATEPPAEPSTWDKVKKWWNGQAPTGPAPQGPQTSHSLMQQQSMLLNGARTSLVAMHAGATTNDNSSSTVTHVNGPITVSTRATDAKGTAVALGTVLSDPTYIMSRRSLA